jgi:Fe2+ transport system protein FeoA
MNTTPLQLCDLAIGSQGRVLGFGLASKVYRHKLLAMGLTPKTEFKVVRVAPLGDPIELQVRGFALSLRKEEARCLQVERISL